MNKTTVQTTCCHVPEQPESLRLSTFSWPNSLKPQLFVDSVFCIQSSPQVGLGDRPAGDWGQNLETGLGPQELCCWKQAMHGDGCTF